MKYAYTRTYAGNQPSSRVKDLVDLAVIAHTTTADAERLIIAIDEIFARRDTHPVPAALQAPPKDWATGWRRRAADGPAGDNLLAGHQIAAALLDPVVSGRVREGSWNPAATAWE